MDVPQNDRGQLRCRAIAADVLGAPQIEAAATACRSLEHASIPNMRLDRLLLPVCVLLGVAATSRAEKHAGASEADQAVASRSRHDASFAMVDVSPKDDSISREEWTAAAESGLLATVGAKISAASSAFSVATFNAISMTIATELGDKTFLIAAVMSMRFPRVAVFAGAIGALLTMTVLSVGIGVAVPALLPKVYTHYAAAALFAYFGLKLLKEARDMGKQQQEQAEGEGAAGGAGGEGGEHEKSEMEEAEEEVAKLALSIPLSALDKKTEGGSGSSGAGGPGATAGQGGSSADPESGMATGASAPRARTGLVASASSSGLATTAAPAPASQAGARDASGKGAGSAGGGTAAAGLAALLWVHLGQHWPVFTHSFSITFLAEWGDRSQIATIAMAAAQNPFGVCLGAMVGHALCTGLAVVGGRMLASRISERTVAFVGGILFLIFAVHSLVVGPDVDE